MDFIFKITLMKLLSTDIVKFIMKIVTIGKKNTY